MERSLTNDRVLAVELSKFLLFGLSKPLFQKHAAWLDKKLPLVVPSTVHTGGPIQETSLNGNNEIGSLVTFHAELGLFCCNYSHAKMKKKLCLYRIYCLSSVSSNVA